MSAPAKSFLTNFSELLEKHRAQIEMALPRHMTPERMIRVALSAVSNTPQLQECRPLTLAAAIVQSSILGLEPNTVLGESYLVPFWNSKAINPDRSKGAMDCQLLTGYRGLIKLARNTGDLGLVDAQAVHEADEFDFEKGSDTWWRHKWKRDAVRGQIQGYWAGYVLKDGTKNFEYMTVAEIAEHRDKYSQGAYKKNKGQFVLNADGSKILQGPWATSPEWMNKKTPLRQVLKLAPQSIELASALSIEERQEAGISRVFTELPGSLIAPEADDDGDQKTGTHDPQAARDPKDAEKYITPAQADRLFELGMKSFKNDRAAFVEFLKRQGYDSGRDIPKDRYDEICKGLAT